MIMANHDDATQQQSRTAKAREKRAQKRRSRSIISAFISARNKQKRSDAAVIQKTADKSTSTDYPCPISQDLVDQLTTELERLRMQDNTNTNKIKFLQKKLEKKQKKKENNKKARNTKNKGVKYVRTRKGYDDLKQRGRDRAKMKLRGLVKVYFPSYTPSQIQNLIKKAFPQAINADLCQLDAPLTLLKQNICGQSMRALRKERTLLNLLGKNNLASERKVYQLKNAMTVETEDLQLQHNDGIVYGCRIKHVKQQILRRLELQRRSGSFILPPDDVIKFCIVLDEGGGFCKMGLLFSTILKRNSPSAMMLVGMYKGKEDRKLLDHFFKSIIDELRAIKEVVVDTKTFQTELFLTGDLKLLKLLLGIRGSNSKNPCVYCTCPKEKQIKHINKNMSHCPRRYDQPDEDLCQDQISIFPDIGGYNIVPPMLHLFLGIADSIINYILNALRSHEGNRSQHVLSKKEKKMLKESKDTLEKYKVLYPTWRRLQLAYDVMLNLDIPAYGTEEEHELEPCEAHDCLCKTLRMQIPQRAMAEPYDYIQDGTTFKWYHSICIALTADKVKKVAKSKKKFAITDHPYTPSSILTVIDSECTYCLQSMKEAEDTIRRLEPETGEGDVDCLEKILFKSLEKAGAYKCVFYYCFTGNHVRNLLKHIDTVRIAAVGIDGFRLDTIPEVDEGLKLLDQLGALQGFTESRMLTEDEVQEYNKLLEQFHHEITRVMGEENAKHKIHILLKHTSQWAKRNKFLGFFTEQSIEAAHATINKNLRRLCTREMTVKLSTIIRWSFEENLLTDALGDDFSAISTFLKSTDVSESEER